MIILLCAINIEEIQLLKMLTIILSSIITLGAAYLIFFFIYENYFQRTKKGKVNGRRLLFLRHSMNIVVKKISKRRMTL